MTNRRFNVLIAWDPSEQSWITYVPALNHLSTFGQTREDALENTREAIEGYLEAAAKEGIAVPETDSIAELVSIDVAVA
jgi:predicted RNase H-like HicB family nuclease